LVSKITISAGFGFRMCLIMQGISQLDELYGRNTRITTLAGSQIKLFVQVNDLETSEFVSEMLGDTTEIYRTPVTRPGQGIFAPRAWTPHYLARPLRSPLELREMSARLSVLMVKNSRSFELTKIRHYCDNPYREFAATAKARPLALPTLRLWADEPLGGAIGPQSVANDTAIEASAVASAETPRARKSGARKAAASKAAAPPPLPPEPAPLPARRPVARTINERKGPRKTLSLGAAPPTPPGESCNLGDVLTAVEGAQRENFSAMMSAASASSDGGDDRLRSAIGTLRSLETSFGDDGKPTTS
jgi:type IV secretion system protein VirD4